ncbi:hypothetical protein [Embleya sp. NPDC059237]|uniref:hypothetical protein n=1 Tax=Embleya sp. NPDC059237 TaxID=3346784 RepID=UPI00369B740C
MLEDPPRMETEADFLAGLVSRIAGEGGTLADAVVRRAVVAAGRQVLEQHPEPESGARTGSAGRGIASDVLCDLYRFFFADVVAEFLRSVVAEKVKSAVPVLPVIDPEDVISGWVADHVLELVPDPCETADTEGSPGGLSHVARGLVPRTVGMILGLVTPFAGDVGESV